MRTIAALLLVGGVVCAGLGADLRLYFSLQGHTLDMPAEAFFEDNPLCEPGDTVYLWAHVIDPAQWVVASTCYWHTAGPQNDAVTWYNPSCGGVDRWSVAESDLTGHTNFTDCTRGTAPPFAASGLVAPLGACPDPMTVPDYWTGVHYLLGEIEINDYTSLGEVRLFVDVGGFTRFGGGGEPDNVFFGFGDGPVDTESPGSTSDYADLLIDNSGSNVTCHYPSDTTPDDWAALPPQPVAMTMMYTATAESEFGPPCIRVDGPVRAEYNGIMEAGAQAEARCGLTPTGRLRGTIELEGQSWETCIEFDPETGDCLVWDWAPAGNVNAQIDGEITIGTTATIPAGTPLRMSLAANRTGFGDTELYHLRLKRDDTTLAEVSDANPEPATVTVMAGETLDLQLSAAEYSMMVYVTYEVAFDYQVTLLPMLADLNCDGVVNNFDITPFVLALTNEAGYEAEYPECDRLLADCNGDGTVNNFDISPFVALLLGN